MTFLILILLAMAGASFYLRKRTSPTVFASLAVAIGLGIYILGIISTRNWYDAELARDRFVEGKGLLNVFFFLSAFSGLWMGSAISTLIANAPAIRGMRVVRVASTLAFFLVTLVATIPVGIYLGFALLY